MRKVVVIWSSPNKDGLTASAKDQFIKGLINAGADVEEVRRNPVFLYDCDVDCVSV